MDLRIKRERLFDEDVYTVHPDDYRALCEQLKKDGFDYPRAISSLDMGYGLRVVLQLTRMSDLAKVEVRTDVSYDVAAVDSVTDLWPGVEWHEREAYDLMGISFRGHPDLRRLLLEEEWDLHPLQKRYDTGGYPIPDWRPADWPDPAPWQEPAPSQEDAAPEGGEGE